MPFDSSAIATTATNKATYLVKSRLRIFPSVALVCADGAAFAAGAAASRPSEASGWREMLISDKPSKIGGICLWPLGTINYYRRETRHLRNNYDDQLLNAPDPLFIAVQSK